MNLNTLKRAIRGWLPEQPNTLQKIRQHSTPLAVGVVITALSLSVFLVSSNIVGYSAVKTVPVLPDTVPEQIIPEATATATPQPTTPPLNVTNLTEEQALAIAEPIIQQYAAENNRVITSIKAQLGMGPDDGSRGGLTLPQVIVLNLTASEKHNKFSYYPVWVIDATFQWEYPKPVYEYDENGTIIGGHFQEGATWIFGYTVTIWADTGEIKSHGENGVM
ncbi:MAG: hypothetical protein NWE96_07330 [Candidatus Bathyarchaeota archaeon]|nr:hypothetical protein [Candidatus Bathyarchaeota archaeon]